MGQPKDHNNARFAPDLSPHVRSIDGLALNPHNLRRHGETDVAALAQSLQVFGQQKPIVLGRDGRTVVAGNGTLAAAQRLGWDTIAAITTDLAEDAAQAYAVADNRTAELSAWDPHELTGWLDDVLADDARLAIGWSAEDRDSLAGQIDTPIKDDDGSPELMAPEEDEESRSQIGEIYELGPHLLLCGDSTDSDQVLPLLATPPTVMIMDPPFDVEYDQWTIQESIRLVMVWARGAVGLRWVAQQLEDDDWGVSTLAFSGQARGWARQEWPCLIHELCYVLRRGVDRGKRCRSQPAKAYGLRVTADNRPFSFYDGLASRSNTMSWAKNPACFAVFLCLARRGEVVYDPCAGSGASLLAADRSGNVWRGVENQPRWCDLIRRRYAQQAGRPELAP